MILNIGDLFVETNYKTGEVSTGIVMRIEKKYVLIKWNGIDHCAIHEVNDVKTTWLTKEWNRPWSMEYYPVKK